MIDGFNGESTGGKHFVSNVLFAQHGAFGVSASTLVEGHHAVLNGRSKSEAHENKKANLLQTLSTSIIGVVDVSGLAL